MVKPRVLFAGVVLVALLFTWLYKEPAVTFTALYALLLLLLVSLASAFFASRLLRVEHNLSQTSVLKGEEVVYTFTLRNRGPVFYPRVALSLADPDLVSYGDEPLSLYIPPRGRARLVLRLSAPYRGVYTVGVASASVSDPLGLFRFQVDWPDLPDLTVLPDGDPDFALPIGLESRQSVYSHNPLEEDYTAMADVRKYQSSDSLRKVHWPLSAKRGELIAKTYQAFTPNTTCLLLDASPVPLEGLRRRAFEDRMATFVVSAADYCARARLPALALLPPHSLELDPSGQPVELYNTLARLEFAADTPRLDALAALPPATNLVLFLSGLSEADWASLAAHVSYDRIVILYFFYPADAPPNPDLTRSLAILEEHGVIVNKVEVPWTNPPQKTESSTSSSTS